MLAIDPGSDAALNAKGAALIDLGKFNDAIPFFDKALGINSMNMQALLHVLDNSLLINASNPTVLTLAGLGKYNQSMVFLDKALAVNPRNPYTLAVKGLALDRLGKTNEAIQFYNKPLTIDRRNYIALTGKEIDLNTTTSIGCSSN